MNPPSAPLHWLTLRFSDPALEAAYREDHRQRSLLLVRVALGLAVILYSGFGVLDPLIIPDGARIAWIIRYGVILPTALGALILSMASAVQRWIDHLWLLLGPMFGLGIVAMIHFAPAPGAYYYYAGLMLVCSYTWSCVHQEPLQAAFSCGLIVAGYEVVALRSGVPVSILISNNFFLITANIIGAAGCYAMNRFERMEFHQKRQIHEQAERLQATLDHVRTLRGLLPMCAWCNRIRDDHGGWSTLMDYIPQHSDASFTHGICPDCRKELSAQDPDLPEATPVP